MSTILQVTRPHIDIVRDANQFGSEINTQIIYGETFKVDREEKDADGNIWYVGQCEYDKVWGWANKKDFTTKEIFTPTHRINLPFSQAYEAPTNKAGITGSFNFASKIQVIDTKIEENTGVEFSKTLTGEWLASTHLSKIDEYEKDYVSTALQFLGTPYRWGGRASTTGLDCSAFVQIVLENSGVYAHKNSKIQSENLGELVGTEVEDAKKGDFVFFRGHVGIMTDDETIIHACGASAAKKMGVPGMRVRQNKLKDLAVAQGGIKSVRRLTL